ncbi:hypothetical protein JR338_06840 [Chloroflexota bacterium]|nr:hypothetical protein JR338_06840 [Chloroflexota bacterium]
MARRKTNPIEKVAAALVGGTPLDYLQRVDGTLVVIGPEGRKVVFTAAEVRKAVEKQKVEGIK